MITDAQVHLWEPNRPSRPWHPKMKPHIPEPMTAERMLAMMDETGVDRAIISPPGLVDRKADYALESSAKYPRRFRVMPWFEPGDRAHFRQLPHWLDDPRVCSLRLGLNAAPELYDTPVMKMLEEGDLDPLFEGCERYGIPIAVYRREGCGVMERAIRRFPGMKVIIDHFNCAEPGPQQEAKLRELEYMARYPNVYVKVSSLPKMSSLPAPYPDLAPMLKRAVTAYGARRLMWGSDQTQIMLSRRGSYNDSVDTIRAASWLSAEDREWMLNGTAASVFNWQA